MLLSGRVNRHGVNSAGKVMLFRRRDDMRHLTTTGGLVLPAYAANMHGTTSAGLEQHYGAKHPGERASAKPHKMEAPNKPRIDPGLFRSIIARDLNIIFGLMDTFWLQISADAHAQSDVQNSQLVVHLVAQRRKALFLDQAKDHSCNCAAWNVFS